MREIKFRGMDINGDWHYGLVGYKSTTLLPGGKTGWFISDIDGAPWAYQVRPETIGQCTGLKDKNGKLIYEGDIVRVNGDVMTIPIEYENEKAFVNWDEDGFFLHFESGEIERLFQECWEYEVVGNIHTNTKLLEDNNVH